MEIRSKNRVRPHLFLAALVLWTFSAPAQVPPSESEKRRYTGLLAAAAQGDARRIRALTAAGENPDVRDAHRRTPLHVAAHGGHHDIVTIAAVANDVSTLKLALSLGASAKNVTSRYDGTALIAAAHLGHAEVVRTLIRAGTPLDHVNNLGWTALIESVVLGDGGARHIETLKALVDAGAQVNLPDRDGRTPLALARARGFGELAKILQAAGGR